MTSSMAEVGGFDDGLDYFDHLPDPILLVIFDKILDAKSLCRCLSVSRRFAALVPQVDSIAIEMNPSSKVSNSKKAGDEGRHSGSKNFMRSLVPKFVLKPLLFLGHMLGKKANGSSGPGSDGVGSGAGGEVFDLVGSVLKNFSSIRSLELELPCHGGSEIGLSKIIPLLKWEAGFGKELERCVIIGANSIADTREKNTKVVAEEGGNGGGGDENEPLFSDEELKMRIIWIISCLIASSLRHNLLKKTVRDCPKLNSAVISDAGQQGKLCMNAAQIKELRDSIENNTTSTNTNEPESDSITVAEAGGSASGGGGGGGGGAAQMGYVGNLVMKLWYVKELELPCSGKVMKGATLVVIRPDGSSGKLGGEVREREKEIDGLSLNGVFDGDEIFGEAAKELLRRKGKKMYRLEMNSF